VSKVEAQRAMRDARYAAYQAKLAADAKAAATPSSPASTRPVAPKSPAPKSPAPESPAPSDPQDAATAEVASPAGDAAAAGGSPQPELCGHRNIGNKGCSRPAGHTEKNHRYK
jgi:hypothetical protein